jgi:hypothetical protein
MKKHHSWLIGLSIDSDINDLAELFRRETKEPDKERRRQLAISWLKDAGLMSKK